MSIPYTHTATITRLALGTTPRDDFGQPTVNPADTTIYSGSVDYQDMSFRERRTIFGDESPASVGWLYFPEELFPTTIRTDDRFSITAEEVTLQGVVIDVDRLSLRALCRAEVQPTDA